MNTKKLNSLHKDNMMKIVKVNIALSILTMSVMMYPDHITKSIDTLEDEIAFWAFQEKEHVEFCVDFTDKQELKNEGLRLANEFEKIHQSPEDSKNKFLNLTKQAKKFQKKIASSLKKNHPDYKIRKDLIDHMNLEANYVEKKVNSKLSAKEEIKFWIEEHEGEAKATAYFIVEQDTPLKKEANELTQDLKKKEAHGQPELRIASIANTELNEISEKLEADPELTRMPQKLAEHEKRERERAAEIFKRFSLE